MEFENFIISGTIDNQYNEHFEKVVNTTPEDPNLINNVETMEKFENNYNIYNK